LGLMVFVDLDGLLTGAVNWLGWLLFALDLSLSIGFGYFAVRKFPA